MDGQVAEQLFAAFEQLLERVHEQALAEAARARQEVVLGVVVQQFAGVDGLVHVVEAFLADLAEGLNADGQLALGHEVHSTPRTSRSPARIGGYVVSRNSGMSVQDRQSGDLRTIPLLGGTQFVEFLEIEPELPGGPEESP